VPAHPPALLLGYGVDLALADPPRLHPVAGFGRLAAVAERSAYAPRRARGAAVTAGLVAAAAAGAEVLAALASPPAATAAVTWTALGGRSLRREARAVADLVARGDLPSARHRLGSLCGRDAAALDAAALRRAVIESLAENTADAVVGTLLWGALLGAGGAAAHRAANTLDAMFGHHSERYEAFGWAAARLDDAMNWPVARLTALLSAALAPLTGGSAAGALRAWRRDAGAHPSPNAGQVEAAFAGALGVELGGPLSYRGHAENRPRLGVGGRAPDDADVRRAARLSALVGAAAALIAAAAAEGMRR
jgi:adenosylcobinamide-phosphate synthase